MAGHLSLRKQDEPKLFALIEILKDQMPLYCRTVKDFDKFSRLWKSKRYDVMKLSKDYVENPETEFAVMFGKVNVESITDEHKSLTHGIDVEVHFTVKEKEVEIKDIFWVA